MDAIPHSYVVVARAPSAARFLPEDDCVISGVPTAQGPVRIAMRTRWEDTGLEHPIPRELWFDVRGNAQSLDAAAAAFGEAARAFGPLIAFVANVEVGLVEVHLGLDATPGISEHDFMQVFLPDRHRLPTEGRRIDPELLAAFIKAATQHREWSRLARALGHYELALRSWFLGGESLALAHLFIAGENLTRSVVRHECEKRGMLEEDLARSVDIDPDDPRRPRWRDALNVWARNRFVFGGDAEAHRLAREASDGLEHGFMDFGDIQARARKITGRTFHHLRSAILDLVLLPDNRRERLRKIPPRDVRSRRKIMRGVFVGGDDLAAPDQEYPILRWASSTSKFVRVGDDLSASFTERLHVVAGEGVVYRGKAFELRGRNEPGTPPIDLSPVEATTTGPGLPSPVDQATRDAVAYMEAVAAAVDTAVPISTAEEVAPLEVTHVDALALRKYWRTRSLFHASLELVRSGWSEEAIVLGQPLWDESMFLAQFAEAGTDRAGLFLKWRHDSLRLALEILRELKDADPDVDIREAQSGLEHELGAGFTQAKASLGVAELPRMDTDKRTADRAGRRRDYADYLLVRSVMEGLDSTATARGAAALGSSDETVGLSDKTREPSVVIAAARTAADSYLACYASAAKIFGWTELHNAESLLSQGRELEERYYPRTSEA